LPEKQGKTRKTRTGIAFWTAKNCKHFVDGLSAYESGVDEHGPGLVVLSEVSLAEPQGRRVRAKSQTDGE